MKTSEEFELQIERIHNLIEQPGSKVTWNDRNIDPDNPSQKRQIDITIHRDNKLTLIEYRIHAKKQDVKWIEELLGRRISLKADTVIAVSAKGFTKGAISKAKSYGIILRDTISLTEEEIREWGHQSKVWLTYYNYKDVHLTFIFEKAFDNKISIDNVFSDFQELKNAYWIFESVSKEMDEKNPKRQACQIKAMVHNNKKMVLDGKQV